MSWRTSLAGLLAGLSFISAALAQPGPWTVARVLAAAALPSFEDAVRMAQPNARKGEP